MPTTNDIWHDLFDTQTGTTTASLRQRIIQESVRQGVDPALMLALAQHESGFNPNAVSPKDVTGLFQVTNDTGKDYGQTPQTRRNPDVSMQAGIAYFKTLLRETGGDVRQALTRYGDPNVADYPERVYANYAAQAADVPQNAQTQRLMQRTQRSMQPRQSQTAAPALRSLDDIRRDLGLQIPAAPPPTAQPVKPTRPAPAQPEGNVQAEIQAIPPLQPANVGGATEMTWQGPALREGEAPRQVDPRTMDDDTLLKQIGVDPALVKQSRFYKPGIFQNMLVTPGSFGERLMQSPLGGVLEGLKMPLAGAEQLAAHGLEAAGITSPADTAFTDAMIKLKRTEYAQAARPTVNVPVLGPVSPPELAGQMLLPIPGAGGVLAMNPAGSFLANTGRGLVNAAVGGAIGGATQPVYDPGTTYAQQKAGQVGTGAVAGTAIGAVPAVIGAATGVNRAARAVEQAQAGTAEDMAAYAQQQAERARASQAAASKAETQAAQRTAQQQADYLQQRREQALASEARVSKAEVQAAQRTVQQQADYLQQQREQGLASEARVSKAETYAAQRTAEQQAEYVAQQRERALASEARVSKAETQARAATEQRHAAWLQQMETQRQQLAGELLQRQDRMTTAQRLVDEANAEAESAYQTGSREAYQAAVEKMRTLERDRQAAVRDYDTAVQAHQSVAEQLQAFPEKYAPQMPQRTIEDVMRDLRFLDQEGAPREAVIKRLGAQDLNDAARMLSDEGEAYMQAGQQMPARPGEAVAPSFRQPSLPTPSVGPAVPELQEAIRRHGKIRLAGEAELQSDLGSYITQKEVGRDKALLNNKSGLTPEQMAERLQQDGFAIADKDELLAALRESMAGRPVYPQAATMEAPAFPASAAVPESVPDLGGGKVSSRLYARFDEAGARTPVDFTPAKNAVAEVRDQLGMVPPSGQPTVIQKIAKDIDDMGTQGNASQGYEIMKSLGKALRSSDGKTRYLAQQIFEGVTNAMEQSAPPELLTMLQQAKTAWKAEQGVNVLHELFGKRPGILKENAAGQVVVNVATLRNSLKNKRMADELTKWLGPEAYNTLVADVNAVQAPPAIPRQAPARTSDAAPLPGLVDVGAIPERPVPQTIWDLPRATGTRTQPGQFSPVTLEELPQMSRPVEPGPVAPTPWNPPPAPVEPGYVGPTPWRPPPPPVEPGSVTPTPWSPPPSPVEPGPVAPTPWSPPPTPREPELPPWKSLLSARELAQPSLAIPAALTFAKSGAYLPAAVAGVAADLTSYGLAHVLLSPAGRPFLQYLMSNGGVIPPEVAARLGYIGGAASSRPERAGERGRQVDESVRRAREQLRRGGR